MNAPNLLSISRMVLAVPVALAIVRGQTAWALGLGAVALLTMDRPKALNALKWFKKEVFQAKLQLQIISYVALFTR